MGVALLQPRPERAQLPLQQAGHPEAQAVAVRLGAQLLPQAAVEDQRVPEALLLLLVPPLDLLPEKSQTLLQTLQTLQVQTG